MHLFHKYQPIKVEQLTTTQKAIYDRLAGNYIQLPEPIIRHITRVLKRCECGKLKTQEIDGVWSLSEVKGEELPTSNTE